jgi:hypothetical protein
MLNGIEGPPKPKGAEESYVPWFDVLDPNDPDIPAFAGEKGDDFDKEKESSSPESAESNEGAEGAEDPSSPSEPVDSSDVEGNQEAWNDDLEDQLNEIFGDKDEEDTIFFQKGDIYGLDEDTELTKAAARERFKALSGSEKNNFNERYIASVRLHNLGPMFLRDRSLKQYGGREFLDHGSSMTTENVTRLCEVAYQFVDVMNDGMSERDRILGERIIRVNGAIYGASQLSREVAYFYLSGASDSEKKEVETRVDLIERINKHSRNLPIEEQDKILKKAFNRSTGSFETFYHKADTEELRRLLSELALRGSVETDPNDKESKLGREARAAIEEIRQLDKESVDDVETQLSLGTMKLEQAKDFILFLKAKNELAERARRLDVGAKLAPGSRRFEPKYFAAIEFVNKINQEYPWIEDFMSETDGLRRASEALDNIENDFGSEESNAEVDSIPEERKKLLEAAAELRDAQGNSLDPASLESLSDTALANLVITYPSIVEVHKATGGLTPDVFYNGLPDAVKQKLISSSFADKSYLFGLSFDEMSEEQAHDFVEFTADFVRIVNEGAGENNEGLEQKREIIDRLLPMDQDVIMKTLKGLGLSETDSIDKANDMLSNMSLSELQRFEQDLGRESNEDDKKKERLEILRKMTFGEWFASEYAGEWGSESFFDAPRDKQREAMRKYMELFEEDANYEVDRESMIKVLMSFEKIEKTIAGLGLDEKATPDDVQKALDRMSAEDLNKLYENVENDNVKPASESNQNSGANTGTGSQQTGGTGANTGAQPTGSNGSDTGAQPTSGVDTSAPVQPPVDAEPKPIDTAEPAGNPDGGATVEGAPVSGNNLENIGTDYDSLLRTYAPENLPGSSEEVLSWADSSVRGMRMREVFGKDKFVDKVTKGIKAWNDLTDGQRRSYLMGDYSAFGGLNNEFDNLVFLSSLGILPDPSKL